MKVLLAVLAVLASVSAYSMVTDPTPATTEVDWSGWFTMPALAAAAVLYLWFQRARRLGAELVPGVTALREQRLTDARALLARLRERHGASLLLGPPVHFHEGLVHLQLGDLAAAEASLLLVERRGWLGVHQDIRLQTAIALAQLMAIRGASWIGRQWLPEALRRRDKLGAPLAHRGELLFAEMLMLVREGRFDKAVALHDAAAAELERTEPVHRLRLWWALAAYAAFYHGGPRNPAAAEPLLRRLRPTPPHELAHLVVRWSELRTFLTTHGVDAAAFVRRDAMPSA